MTDVGQDLHLGRVLGQRYRLISPVGTGASARVYLAEDTTLRRRVAVKLLHNGLATDSTFRKRFRAEAHAAAQLSHPNIMAVFDWSEGGEVVGATPADPGRPDAPAYLVTELLTGGSLRSVLDAGHRLSLSQALIVGLHAAEGLAYAHYNGFVHRDIKPANLLFGAEGRLRIADFGIARAVAEAAWTEPEGALVGTARYAAPEQASGSSIDGRADVYALAVTLIEAVTGVTPLVGSSPLATMVMRQDEDITVPAALGPLAAALTEAGRAVVQHRSTAEELAFALRAAASDLPRPTKLPLRGLAMDPRTVPPQAGVLVLEAEGPAIELSGAPDLTAHQPTLALPTTPTSVDLPAVDQSVVDQSVPGNVVAEPLEVDPVVGPDSRFGGDDEPALGIDEEDRRRQWPIVVLMVLLIAGAIVAYRGRDSAGFPGGSDSPEVITHPVGTYIGRPFDEVIGEIERNGWTYVVTDGRDDDAEPGDVIEQSPPAGEELNEGLEVTLVVSEGGILRIVPELVGLQLEVALAELANAGLFLGGTGEVFDESAPKGQVVSASVAPGDEAETGTAIDLVWSKGPQPREIPDLGGEAAADAQAVLDQMALVYVIAEEYSQTVPQGAVIRTEPVVGSFVERGAEITVVISLGRPFVDVPNVVGLSAAEAADILTQAGFVVTDTVGPANGEVLATDPPAGEPLRQGSSIVIFARGAGG